MWKKCLSWVDKLYFLSNERRSWKEKRMKDIWIFAIFAWVSSLHSKWGFFLIYNAKKKLELLLFIQILFIFNFRFFINVNSTLKSTTNDNQKSNANTFLVVGWAWRLHKFQIMILFVNVKYGQHVVNIE